MCKKIEFWLNLHEPAAWGWVLERKLSSPELRHACRNWTSTCTSPMRVKKSNSGRRFWIRVLILWNSLTSFAIKPPFRFPFQVDGLFWKLRHTQLMSKNNSLFETKLLKSEERPSVWRDLALKTFSWEPSRLPSSRYQTTCNEVACFLKGLVSCEIPSEKVKHLRDYNVRNPKN